MRRVLVAAAALLVWGSAASATVRNLVPRTDGHPAPAAVSTERSASAAVRIDGRGGGRFDIGSGVGVAPNVVLTNAHLIDDPVTLVTRRDDSVLSTGRIERAQQGLDLAVAVTDGPDLVPITLAPQDPEAGDTVTMIGYPSGDGPALQPRAPCWTVG